MRPHPITTATIATDTTTTSNTTHPPNRSLFPTVHTSSPMRVHTLALGGLFRYKLASATRPDRNVYDLMGPWYIEGTNWPDLHWDLNVQLT